MYQNVRFNPFQPYVSDLKTHDIVIYDPFYKGHFTEAGWICYKDLQSALRWAASFRLTFHHISVNPPQIPSWPSTRPTSLRTRSQDHIGSLQLPNIKPGHHNYLKTFSNESGKTHCSEKIQSLCGGNSNRDLGMMSLCTEDKTWEKRVQALSGLNESSWVKLLSLWK
jgi:hypothetical protein